MGTRGAWGFIFNGKAKVAYNQFDSYPDGMGKSVLEFVATTPVDEMKQIAERIVLVNNDVARPTKEQVAECQKWTDLKVSEQSTNDWYCLLRNAQGDPSAYKDGLIYMEDAESFLQDSLFCEWAYLINLDSGVLEVYKGFNKDRKAPGRYAAEGGQKENGSPKEYFGVALLTGEPISGVQKWTDEQLAATLKEWQKRAYPDEEDSDA